MDGDSYLLQLLRYIHRNPIRAKIVKNLNDFEWSSHQGYISKTNDWDWLYKDFILSIFSNNKKNQLIEYNEYMGLEDKEEVLTILDSKKWSSFLGSDEFILTMKEKYYVNKRDKEVPESYNLSPDVSWIKEVVCKYYDLDSSSLCISKRRVFNEPRNVAVYLSRYFTNSTLEQLGEDFNLNTHSAASNIITGIKKLKKNSLKFNKKVEEVKKLCLKCQIKT